MVYIKIIFKLLYRIKLLTDFLFYVLKASNTLNLKRKFIQVTEICKLFFTDFDLLIYYFSFGLNKNNVNIRDFIGRRKVFKLLKSGEKKIQEEYQISKTDFSVMVKDKFYLNSFLENNEIPCIKSIALIHASIFFFKEGKTKMLIEAFPELDFPVIIKNTILEYNEGFNKCEYYEGKYFINGEEISIYEINKKFRNGTWVVQPLVKSHSQIRKINSSALNTTRIVTCWIDGKPKYLGGFQAFAVGNTPTDSWGAGSIYVGINVQSNELMENGYFHPKKFMTKKIREHPTSKMVFKDYSLPLLRNAVKLCLNAHGYLPYNFLIGWDVTITDDGPFILEGNERPGMNAVQLINGGLAKTIRNAVKKY